MNRARIIQMVAIGAFLSVVGSVVVGGLVFAWFARDLPNPGEVVRREGFSTKIFDRNGELLYDVFDEAKRIPVDIEQVPEVFKQATIAVEDQDFYTHGGFDPRGILRSAVVNLLQGKRYGGSTLTQQLVKNALLTNEKRISRKIKEFVLAVQIERRFSKDEILAMYMNEAPYGGTAVGIVAAAETYFGKEVSELNLVESVILAGLPQRPSYYSPFGSNPKAYVDRATVVLRRMREDGYISREEEEKALSELDTVEFASPSAGIKAPHFVFYVIDQLNEMYGEELVQNGGLRIETSLDLKLQEEAQIIVAEEVESVADLAVGNGAAVVVDPNSGEILAMVGSKDFQAEDYDGQVNVALALRQPGSSIKPVTYALALEEGYTPASMIMDVKTEFPGGAGNPPYVPVNYDGTYHGPVSLRKSLGSSLNIPAVKLLAQLGIRDMLDLAYRMGLETLEPTDENMRRFGLSVTLGGGEVRLLDLTSAYSAFANGGLKVEPVSILKVMDSEGNEMFSYRALPAARVMQETTAYLMNSILSDNDARLLSFGANSYLNMNGRPIAVKTGTTNDRRDNWTVGWSSSVVVGVWVGNNDNSPMKGVASGVTGASPIWRKIILKALEDRPASEFVKPNGIESIFVDVVSGYPEHDGFASVSEVVASGTLPSLPDPIHVKLKLCRDQNKLATAAQVAQGNYDEKEYFIFREDDPFGSDGVNRWQKGIDEWLATQGDERYRPPTETCEGGEFGVVRVNSPENEKNYSEEKVNVDMDVFADSKVVRLEVVVNGEVKKTFTQKPYSAEVELGKGKFELKGRAVLENSKTIESGTLRLGMGGVSWDQPDPTPTPSPTPSVSPTPAATP